MSEYVVVDEKHWDGISAPITYDLKLSATEGGSVTAIIGTTQWTVFPGQTMTIYNIVPGSVVYLSGTPQSGYHFKNWQGQPVNGNTNLEVSFPMNADYHVTGVFEQDAPPLTYDLKMSATEGGSVTAIIGTTQWTVFPGQTMTIYNIVPGSVVYLSGTPQSGYHFKNWQGQPVNGNTNPEVNFPMNADYHVTGVFEQDAPPPVRDGTLIAAQAKADTWPDWKPIDMGQVHRWPPGVSITTQWQIENTGDVTATFFGALKGIVSGTDLLTGTVELAPGQRGWVDRVFDLADGQYEAEFELRVLTGSVPPWDALESHFFFIVAEDVPPGEGVRGIVVDGITGGPIQGVSVRSDTYQDTTDSQGRYEISDIPAGDYTFSYTASGYDSAEREVTIIAGEWTHLDVVLMPHEDEKEDDGFPWHWVGIGAGAVLIGLLVASREQKEK